MNNVNTRLTHRQRQALETQKLILTAARDLFLEQGYPATTIEGIAERAGVAVSTVYAIYGSKRGMLKAIREAWHQESGQREIYQDALRESDPQRRLELAAHATRRQWETSAAMIRIYRGAAVSDRDAAVELGEALRGRRAWLAQFIDATAAMLQPGLDTARAGAMLRALTLPEVFEELVDEAGWSPDDYEAWLARTLQQQLLGCTTKQG